MYCHLKLFGAKDEVGSVFQMGFVDFLALFPDAIAQRLRTAKEDADRFRFLISRDLLQNLRQ